MVGRRLFAPGQLHVPGATWPPTVAVDFDEMFVRLNGETVDLWRAVDQEGEILESFVTKRRDKATARMFMKKKLKRHGYALKEVAAVTIVLPRKRPSLSTD